MVFKDYNTTMMLDWYWIHIILNYNGIRILVEISCRFDEDFDVDSTRNRRGFDIVSTTIRRWFDVVILISNPRWNDKDFNVDFNVDSTRFRCCHFDVESASKSLSFRRGFGEKSMRFWRHFDVVISTSNLHQNNEDFDEVSARNRWGFDFVSTLSFRCRIHVEMMRISTRFRREINEVSTSFWHCHFDIESASKWQGFRRGFSEKSMRFRRRFDIVILTSNS